MKNILLCILALCLCLPLAACADTEDGYNVPDGYALFSSDFTEDFYAIVPDDWTIDMSTGVLSAKCSSVDSTNVSILTQSLSKSMTLEEYWQEYGVKNASVLGEVTYTTEGTSLLLARQGDRQVAAKHYVYKATVDGTVYVFDQVISILDGYVYILTMTATEANYTTAHQNEWKDMLSFFLFRR